MLTMAPDAPTAIDSDLARWLERSEALAFARLTAAAERTPGNPAGASRLEIGGGVAVASEVSKDIILFDRALGFGFDEPLTEETVEAVAAFFRHRARPRSSIRSVRPPMTIRDVDTDTQRSSAIGVASAPAPATYSATHSRARRRNSAACSPSRKPSLFQFRSTSPAAASGVRRAGGRS